MVFTWFGPTVVWLHSAAQHARFCWCVGQHLKQQLLLGCCSLLQGSCLLSGSSQPQLQQPTPQQRQDRVLAAVQQQQQL